MPEAFLPRLNCHNMQLLLIAYSPQSQPTQTQTAPTYSRCSTPEVRSLSPAKYICLSGRGAFALSGRNSFFRIQVQNENRQLRST
jgi:hypothetical protein